MGRRDPVEVTSKSDHLTFCDEKKGGSVDKGAEDDRSFGGSKFSSSYCGADAIDACQNRDIVQKTKGRNPIDEKYGAWGPVFKDRKTFNEMHQF